MQDSPSDERRLPAYSLAKVRDAFAEDRFEITRRVSRYLRRRGWDRSFLVACMVHLDPADFHKAQEHRDRPGVWLDIYRPRLPSGRLYVKFAVDPERDRFIVLSFCADGEAH